MKRTLVGLLALVMLGGFCLQGCGLPQLADKDTLDIVTTAFPLDDWTRAIVAGAESRTEIRTLSDRGMDLHNFQPTVKDILRLSECDVFIYVGGASDEWVEEALEGVDNPDLVVINLMEVLEDRLLHEHEAECLEEHDHHDHVELYDEHIWLSLKNAEILCHAIAEGLCQAAPERAELYRANAQTYTARIRELDEEYKAAVDAAECNTLVFADRFPFLYLMEDYGLSYHAAFSGCSTESDASFRTILSLANAMDDEDLSCVMILEGADRSLAEAVIQETECGNQMILELDSMQSVTARDVEDGMTYVSVMESNLAVLRQALNRQ